MKKYQMTPIVYSLTALIFAANFFSCSSRKQPESTQVVTDPGFALLSEKIISIPEPSGLAYNAKTRTLFSVSDQNGMIYEVSLTGDILHEIQVSSNDLEGIAFSKNFDTMYVAEEATYQVVAYSLTGQRYSTFKNVTSSSTKNGYEGITLNGLDHVVILNEKSPMLVLETDKQGVEISRRELAYTTDISDICYDAAENCYWLISDESKKILKLKTDFTLINSWQINVAQAEGIAVTDDKIYVVSDSDSNLLTFSKPK